MKRTGKNKETQMAFDYCVYMMLGSYFTKTTCSTPMLEKKLYLHYLQQKKEQQYHMEDQVIRYVEQHLLRVLPQEIWREQVEVRLNRNPQSGWTEIRFIGKTFILRVMGKQGREAQFLFSLWERDVCRKSST